MNLGSGGSLYMAQDPRALARMLPELTLLEMHVRALRNNPSASKARDALNFVDSMRPLLLRLAVALEQESQHGTS